MTWIVVVSCDNSDFFLTPGEKNKCNGRVEDGVLMDDHVSK